ncbi:AAWKG family protein [Streptomyces sp. JV185]|uniref:AAWKG family protein n=1 Tax=Streptomyces sp. JV185 TaxID=858638 RepID=UPI002E78296A|nr:AAWKG family protein [Streptomyces sp. JV185]MEE1767844.1 AAWKG family protein [Streptomyces sp. JV185]
MSTPTSQSYDADDYWGQAVTKLTGYPMPSRKGLFTGLSSKEKSPLFRMSLDKIGVQSVVDAAKQGSLKSSGQDYDLYFYTNKNGHVEMYHARLVFIGSFMSENGRSRGLEANESLSGGKYKGKYGDDWDIGPLGQYMGGPGAALSALITAKTTQGAEFNGASVPDANVVDLNSFQHTAQAFDRAAQFFVDQGAILAGWEKSLGSEQSAWKGQAAGIFWQLVHQLSGNYENYKEQLGAGATYDAVGDPAFTPKSSHSKQLMAAQQTLLTQGKSLQTAWNAWMGRNEHDPHFFLIKVLNDILTWLTEHNIPFITSTTTQGNVINPTSTTTYSTKDGFQEPHPTYGDLADIQNWAKVGEEAVRQWNEFIDTAHPDIEGLQLGLNGTAQTVLSNLNNAWIDSTKPFETPLTTKNTGSLTEFYTKEKTEKAKEETDKNNKDLNTALDNLNKGIGDMGNNVTKSLNDFGGGPGGIKDLLGNNDTKDLNPGSGSGLDGKTGKELIDDLNPGNSDSTQGNGNTTHTGPLNPLFPGPNTPTPSVTGPDGTTVQLNKDRNPVMTFPNGDKATYDPKTGKYTVTPKDGKPTVHDLNPGQSVTNPDGSVTKLNKDGTLTTTHKDGSKQIVDPATGKVTDIDKNGKETVSDLNPRTDLQWPNPKTHFTPPPTHQDLNHDVTRDLNHDLDRSLRDLDRNLRHDLNSLGGNSHSLNNSSSSGGGQNRSGGGDYEEYDNTFHPGGTLGAPPGTAAAPPPTTELGTGPGTGTGSDQDGSTPLNPAGSMGGMGMGGMGMGGMGMGGMGAGGQAGGSSGERVRNVLTESGPGTRGGTSRTGGRRGADEERSARRTRTATSSTAVAGGAAGGTQGGQATGSGERDRVHWVAEDEDVWGAEEGGTPTVIGR